MKKENKRTCIVTRQNTYKDELIRFVLGPGDCVVPDLKEKLPGRGVWVTNDKQIVQKAMDKNLFAAGFKKKVSVNEQMVFDIEEFLLAGIVNGLSIAKKSGLVITGFSKVEALARRGDAKLVFHASDGREDGLGKIKSALLAGQLAGGNKKKTGEPFVRLKSELLDKALGSSNAVHVALTTGGATASLKAQIARVEKYCGQT